MTETDLRTFEEAFSDNHGSCSGLCECGVEYYSEDSGYDWYEGEYQALVDGDAVSVGNESVWFISFEGSTYIFQCHCWHERAERIKAFLDGHIHKIANYINLEKKRLQDIADNAPEIKEPTNG